MGRVCLLEGCRSGGYPARCGWLLAELFEALPEVGDLDKPKLVLFFDEAHLLFDDATPAFIDSVTSTVRLIRSKGVGVFFITQTPKDIPSDVLGQLGNRIQHALRAFTPDDEKALTATVKTYPKSTFYDIGTLLTPMGARGSYWPHAWPRRRRRARRRRQVPHSRQGQAIERQVMRGVFGMLKKR